MRTNAQQRDISSDAGAYATGLERNHPDWQ